MICSTPMQSCSQYTFVPLGLFVLHRIGMIRLQVPLKCRSLPAAFSSYQKKHQQILLTEQQHRHIRFFRELVRASQDAHSRINSSSASSSSSLAPFPGAAALVFQSEHTHRSHDIPSMDFRTNTAFEYLVGSSTSTSPSSPLFPLGLQAHGPNKCPPGGFATCALFSVRRCDDEESHHRNNDIVLRFRASVDVFVPLAGGDLSETTTTAASSNAEHELWHHDNHTNVFAKERGGHVVGERLVSLMNEENDTMYSLQVHHHSVHRVTQRLWDVLAHSSIQSKTITYDSALPSPSYWHGESLTRSYDIPYFVLSCPPTRSCTNDCVPPVFLHEVANNSSSIQKRKADDTTAASVVLHPEEVNALKRELCTHPVSVVLDALLLFRRIVEIRRPSQEVEGTLPVTDPEASQEGAPKSNQSVDGAVFQYALSAGVARAWGVPQKWPFCAYFVPKTGGGISASSAIAPFVQVENASRTTTTVGAPASTTTAPPKSSNGEWAPQRVFTRSRTVLSASPMIDKLRAYKTPYDTMMFMRSAFVTVSSFTEGMRSCGHQHSNNTAADFSENDILQEMTRGGWSGAKKLRSMSNNNNTQEHHYGACTMQNSVFGYPPVVAAGRNACAVHYTAASSVVGSDDWVLVDAGAEIGGIYTTDCTRCWPAGASAVQRFCCAPSQQHRDPALEVYRSTLAAQMAILSALRPGMSKRELSDVSRSILAAEIEKLFATFSDCSVQNHTSATTWEERSAYVRQAHEAFAIHSVGHFTGFDIHEKGTATNALDPGTMHTIEPGIYIRGHDDVLLPSLHIVVPAIGSLETYRINVPKELGGIGMRVEDSVLMLPDAGTLTPTGHTRDDYLDAAVEEYSRWNYTHHQPAADCDPRRSCDLSLVHAARVSFINWQRNTIYGGVVVASQLAVDDHLPFMIEGNNNDGDRRSIPLSLGQKRAEGYGTISSEGDHWYPFPVVVITAGVPKCVSALQKLLRN